MRTPFKWGLPVGRGGGAFNPGYLGGGVQCYGETPMSAPPNLQSVVLCVWGGPQIRPPPFQCKGGGGDRKACSPPRRDPPHPSLRDPPFPFPPMGEDPPRKLRDGGGVTPTRAPPLPCSAPPPSGRHFGAGGAGGARVGDHCGDPPPHCFYLGLGGGHRKAQGHPLHPTLHGKPPQKGAGGGGGPQ